jgi:hypothetical protein
VAAIVICGTYSSQAQFTITLPSIPKIKKDKPQPAPTPSASEDPRSDTGTTAPARRDDVQAAPVKKGCEDDAFFQVHNENIQKTIDQAKSFTPGRDYYVQDFNDDENVYLKAALSEKKRASWEERWEDDAMKKCINDRLDELAAVAEKTIGGYKPVGYTFGTPAEKNILKSGVTDLAQATAVYNVGLKSANWTIVKDEYNLPLRRKRFGTVWAKYPWNKYCTLVYVNLVQEYAGGGTYNSSEAQFVSWEFAGCPAGK